MSMKPYMLVYVDMDMQLRVEFFQTEHEAHLELHDAPELMQGRIYLGNELIEESK